jgi:hypothetical protein
MVERLADEYVRESIGDNNTFGKIVAVGFPSYGGI